MNNKTFILLSRSILDSEVFASQKLLKIWIWCLCKANHKERFVPFKTGKGEITVNVKRGQFIFGRHKAEEELFIDGSTIYKIMQRLQLLGNISIKSNRQYSVITICKYDTYQTPDNYKVTSNEQASNKQVTGKSQASNTNNNVNNVNNVNNEKKGSRRITKFVKPTKQELDDYCQKMKYAINTEKFLAHYNSNGWKVGKNPMRSWQSALTTWHLSNDKSTPKEKKTVSIEYICTADPKHRETFSESSIYFHSCKECNAPMELSKRNEK